MDWYHSIALKHGRIVHGGWLNGEFAIPTSRPVRGGEAYGFFEYAHGQFGGSFVRVLGWSHQPNPDTFSLTRDELGFIYRARSRDPVS